MRSASADQGKWSIAQRHQFHVYWIIPQVLTTTMIMEWTLQQLLAYVVFVLLHMFSLQPLLEAFGGF